MNMNTIEKATIFSVDVAETYSFFFILAFKILLSIIIIS